MSKQKITIDGNKFSNLECFYDEIDQVLTKDLDWDTGLNLDAFNDILIGGFGVYENQEPVKLIWKRVLKSKSDLGLEATKSWYKQKIEDQKLKIKSTLDTKYKN